MSKHGQMTAATAQEARDIQNVNDGGVYSATPPTVADGGWAPKQIDNRGNLKVTLAAGADSPSMETSGADAGSNTSTRLPVSSRAYGFNGSTWDRLRAGLTTLSTTLTGILNTLPWAVYNATPTSRTEGQGGPLQADIKGSLNVNLATKVAGEDQTNDVLKVEQQFVYTNITTQTTTTIKSGAGFLHNVVVNTPLASGVVTMYDNTAGSGSLIGTITFPATLLSTGPVPVTYNVKFSTGFTVVTSGANLNLTVGSR